MSAAGSSAPAPQASLVEPGYWNIRGLAAFLGVSKWTAQRRVNADPAFPVLRGYGPDRYPIERVKAYLQRQEQGRGRAYKTRGFLHLAGQVSTAVDLAKPEEAP